MTLVQPSNTPKTNRMQRFFKSIKQKTLNLESKKCRFKSFEARGGNTGMIIQIKVPAAMAAKAAMAAMAAATSCGCQSTFSF